MAGTGRETGCERRRGLAGRGSGAGSPYLQHFSNSTLSSAARGTTEAQKMPSAFFTVSPPPPAPGGPNSKMTTLSQYSTEFVFSCLPASQIPRVSTWLYFVIHCLITGCSTNVPLRPCFPPSHREQGIRVSGRVTSVRLQGFRNQGSDPRGAMKWPLGPKEGRD